MTRACPRMWDCAANNWQRGPPKPESADNSAPGEFYPQIMVHNSVGKWTEHDVQAGLNSTGGVKKAASGGIMPGTLPDRMQHLFMLRIYRSPQRFCFCWPALMPEKRGHAELHAQKRHRQVIHRCHTVKHREQKFAQGIIHLRVIIRAAPCHSGRVKPASGFCVIKSVTSLVIPIFSGRKSPSSARNRGKSVLTFSRLALMNSGVHFLFFFAWCAGISFSTVPEGSFGGGEVITCSSVGGGEVMWRFFSSQWPVYFFVYLPPYPPPEK